METELIFRLRGDSSSLPGDLAKGRRLVEQFRRDEERTEALRARRMSSDRLRDLQRANREQVREHGRAARLAAREYEQTLSQSFFARLGRRAAAGFKSTLGLGGGGVGGGGGLLGGIASVAGGNILTSVLGGIASQITGGVKAGFDFNKIKEQSLLGFEIKLKGRKEAEDFFRRIEAFAAEAPQELDQVLESTQRLMAAFKPDQALQSLGAITDAVAYQGKVGGEAQESINGIGTALSQILFKNKVQAEEMVQLAERQVNGYKYLAAEIAKTDKAFDALTDEEKQGRVMEMAQQGLLNAKTAVAVIVRGMQEEFGGTAKRLARETAAGMESNISDSLNRTAGIATQSAFERYKQFLGKSLDLLNTGAGERIAGGISAGTGALFDGLEKTLSAISSGNLGQLGLDAVTSAAEGVKSGAKGLYDAGAGAAGQLEEGWRNRLQQDSPSLVMQALGFQAGQSLLFGFVQGARSEGESLRQYLERLAQDPMFKAFFEAIKKAEGGAVNRIVGGRTFSDLSRHPNIVGFRGPAGPSTAAGSYQMTGTNWRDIAPKLGLTDFGAHSQLLAALELFRREGGDRALLSGDVAGATRIAAKHWAGLPGSPLPGREVTQGQFTRFFQEALRQSGGALSGGAPLPVHIVAAPDFSRFPGTPYSPEMEARARGSNTPAPDDLTGGVGRFAGPGNQRAFLEWLYAMERAVSASERTTVVAQSEYSQRVALIAKELDVSQNFVRLAQAHVARILEAERQLSGASGGHFRPDSAFANITPEQAQEAVRIATRSTGEVKQETAELATTVVPQALASVALVAEKTGDAFKDLPPLIKQTGDESRKLAERMAGDVSGIIGNALRSTVRGHWREGLAGLRDDFRDWAVDLFTEWVQSKIYKALLGGGVAGETGGASGGGFSLKGLFGGAGGGLNVGGAVSGGRSGGFMGALKGLFGLGSAGASTAAAGPMVNSAAFMAEFGAPPALAGAAGAGGAGGLGAMAAFFTNPWTIGIAAAALGGFALFKLFGGNKTEKALRDAIQREYGVRVREMDVLKQIKQIGEQHFGRGQVRKRLLETIRLEPVKELIANYAESTGQEARNLTTAAQAADPSHPSNRFTRWSALGSRSDDSSPGGSLSFPAPISGGGSPLHAQAGAPGRAQGLGLFGETIATLINQATAQRDREVVAVLRQNVAVMGRVADGLGTIESASMGDILYRNTDAVKGAIKRSVQEDVNFWHENVAKPVLGG